MVDLGTIVTLQASGYAGGWGLWTAATPAAFQDEATSQLVQAGFGVIQCTVHADVLTTSVLLHQWAYVADIKVRTQAPYVDLAQVTGAVQAAIALASGQAAAVANLTGGDPAQDTSSHAPSLTVALGLVAVIVIAAAVAAHEL